MKAQDLHRWGVPDGDATRIAYQAIKRLFNEAIPYETVRSQILDVIRDPEAYIDHSHWAELAKQLIATPKFVPRETPAPFAQWGDGLDANAVAQMHNACDLPVAVSGALMPDAHLG